MTPSSRRAAVLTGILALTLLAAIVTLSAVATPARKRFALEEVVPAEGEVGIQMFIRTLHDRPRASSQAAAPA